MPPSRDVDKGLRVPRASRSTALGIHRQDRDADRWMFLPRGYTFGDSAERRSNTTFSESELLLWACALESVHPILSPPPCSRAGAATRLAAKKCVVNHFETLPGEEQARLWTPKVEIGGTALANRRNGLGGVSLASTVEEWERAGARSGSAWMKRSRAHFDVKIQSDTMLRGRRSSSRRRRGMTMLTGDSQGSAACGQGCGIDPANVHAELSPSRKLEEVRSRINDLQSDTLNAGGLFGSLCGRGVVAMVGTESNDAALATRMLVWRWG